MEEEHQVDAVKQIQSSRKKTIILGAISLAAALLALFVLLSVGSKDTTTKTTPEKTTTTETTEKPVEKEPVLIETPLTGEMIEEATAASRPITAVVIENGPEARPQSSLHKAGVIFESIAEGGVTRFVALYQHEAPEIIGPVRSLRPYFIDIALMHDAPIAHVGGSAQALQEAKQVGMKDIDEFANTNSFYRATDRFAPHNVYTSASLLDATNERLGYTDNAFDAFSRKDDSASDKPSATNITLSPSSFFYQVGYEYDATNNSYKRSQGGQTHFDRETNQQLQPKVVVALTIPSTIVDNGRYQYAMVGSGKATIFQDGTALTGTWTRQSRSDQFALKDSNGKEISLNRGQTWITALSNDQMIQYTSPQN